MWFHLMIYVGEKGIERELGWQLYDWNYSKSSIHILSIIFEPTQVRISDCLFTLNDFEKKIWNYKKSFYFVPRILKDNR